jgi:hypothetical protein
MRKESQTHNRVLAENASRNITANFKLYARQHFGSLEALCIMLQ